MVKRWDTDRSSVAKASSGLLIALAASIAATLAAQTDDSLRTMFPAPIGFTHTRTSASAFARERDASAVANGLSQL